MCFPHNKPFQLAYNCKTSSFLYHFLKSRFLQLTLASLSIHQLLPSPKRKKKKKRTQKEMDRDAPNIYTQVHVTKAKPKAYSWAQYQTEEKLQMKFMPLCPSKGRTRILDVRE
jgi:hypothetical protein